jgi:hypothetical protein
MRRAARRDSNESELIELARDLHWFLWELDEPCDWLGLYRGRFYAIEIKNPDCEGHADEFTAEQLIFHRNVKNAGGEVLVWRREDDVFKASGARRSA